IRMESVPQPIAEVVFSFVASGSKEDRRNAMLVNSNWLWLARRTFYPTKTLSYASWEGYSEIVRELLKDKRVDPTAVYNYAIRFASSNGNLEVVQELLKDKRVDPSAQNNHAIQGASYYGHLEVVRELLKDKRVDPSAQNNYTIREAS